MIKASANNNRYVLYCLLLFKIFKNNNHKDFRKIEQYIINVINIANNRKELLYFLPESLHKILEKDTDDFFSLLKSKAVNKQQLKKLEKERKQMFILIDRVLVHKFMVKEKI